jgi:hypothetical protein
MSGLSWTLPRAVIPGVRGQQALVWQLQMIAAQQAEWFSAKAQCLAASAWRLRLANIRTELRPVRTMMGHKKVQTMAHNTRLPRVEPPSAVSTC